MSTHSEQPTERPGRLRAGSRLAAGPAPTEPPGFTFAVVAESTRPVARWCDRARLVEEWGYDALLLTDHLQPLSAPVPALAAAAVVTERLLLGTYVLNDGLRNPRVAAGEMLTLHALSSGRALVGLGAGWCERDHADAAVALAPAGDRLRRLRRSLAVVRDTMAAECPPELPRPPLLLGASRPGMLGLAAREADVVSVVAPLGPDGYVGGESMTARAVDEQVHAVRTAAAGRGEPPQLNYQCLAVIVTEDRRAPVDALGRRFGCSSREIEDSPAFLIGSVSEIQDALHARRDRWGLTFVNLPMSAARTFAPVVAEMTRHRWSRRGFGPS